MRDRETMEAENKEINSNITASGLQIEILLDIRDLLIAQGTPKTKPSKTTKKEN